MNLKFDKYFFDELLEQARSNPRLRQNYDLRTSEADNSQRMLNALLPETEVPIHRHPHSSENVICLCGRMDEVLYEEISEAVAPNKVLLKGGFASELTQSFSLREVERIRLCPSEGKYGCVIPAGVWHTVDIFVPSVIYEGKDGKYGEDGSEIFTIGLL